MTYDELCAAVGKIDKEAEQYLIENKDELNHIKFIDNDSLIDLFAWDETPQGHEYWSDIHHKIS